MICVVVVSCLLMRVCSCLLLLPLVAVVLSWWSRSWLFHGLFFFVVDILKL